jgi:hypothetical protein
LIRMPITWSGSPSIMLNMLMHLRCCCGWLELLDGQCTARNQGYE